MAYLVDTNIVIYHLNGVENATQLVGVLFDVGVAISAISFMEISEGLHGRQHTQVAEQRFIAFSNRAQVLDFRREDAIIAAWVRHTMREQGRNVRNRGLDLLIAATALSHDLTLVTNNPSDFDDVPGLRMEVADLHM